VVTINNARHSYSYYFAYNCYCYQWTWNHHTPNQYYVVDDKEFVVDRHYFLSVDLDVDIYNNRKETHVDRVMLLLMMMILKKNEDEEEEY